MPEDADLPRDLIMKEFSVRAVDVFLEDFISLVTMIRCLDAAWAEADNELYAAIDVFKEYVEKFNQKYPGLKIKFSNTTDQGFRIFIFFTKEKSVADIFKNAAGRMNGLIRIGTDADNAIPPTTENIKLMLGKIKDRMFLLYARTVSGSVILQMDKMEKLPELIFNKATVDHSDGAEATLCAYYAVKYASEENIDLKHIRLKFPSIAISPVVSNIGALKG